MWVLDAEGVVDMLAVKDWLGDPEVVRLCVLLGDCVLDIVCEADGLGVLDPD